MEEIKKLLAEEEKVLWSSTPDPNTTRRSILYRAILELAFSIFIILMLYTLPFWGLSTHWTELPPLIFLLNFGTGTVIGLVLLFFFIRHFRNRKYKNVFYLLTNQDLYISAGKVKKDHLAERYRASELDNDFNAMDFQLIGNTLKLRYDKFDEVSISSWHNAYYIQIDYDSILDFIDCFFIEGILDPTSFLNVVQNSVD